MFPDSLYRLGPGQSEQTVHGGADAEKESYVPQQHYDFLYGAIIIA